jgi:hypothetical protein
MDRNGSQRGMENQNTFQDRSSFALSLVSKSEGLVWPCIVTRHDGRPCSGPYSAERLKIIANHLLYIPLLIPSQTAISRSCSCHSLHSCRSEVYIAALAHLDIIVSLRSLPRQSLALHIRYTACAILARHLYYCHSLIAFIFQDIANMAMGRPSHDSFSDLSDDSTIDLPEWGTAQASSLPAPQPQSPALESQLQRKIINAAYIALNAVSTVAIVFLNKTYAIL